MGANWLTTRGAVITVENPKLPAGFCFAEIVVDPALRIVKELAETVAIVGSATVYTQLPVEFVVGATSERVLLGMEPRV